MRSILLAAVLVLSAPLAGCTCNRATGGDARNEARAAKKRAVARQRMMGERTKVGKQNGRSNIARTDVSIWLVDSAKLKAGEDPWVKVDRKVGAHRPAKNALWVLFKGPTPEEEASGLTLFRNGTEGFQGFTLVGDTVTLQLRGGCKNDGGTLTIYDHIKRTMAGFPEIQHVKVLGPDGTTQDLEGKGDSRPACLEP